MNEFEELPINPTIIPSAWTRFTNPENIAFTVIEKLMRAGVIAQYGPYTISLSSKGFSAFSLLLV